MARTFLVVALLLGSHAIAQEAGARVARDKAEVKFNEIERGLYFGVTAGGWFIVNPPKSGNSAQPFSPGQMAQVEIGMDFGDRVSVGALVMGTANRAGADYTGKSGGVASGDFSSIAPGGAFRFNLVGFDDSQDVRRTWIYVRGGAAFAFFSPKPLLPDPDVVLFGGLGVEYYTRLRHFSIGVEVAPAFLLTNASVGFAVSPNLRYAF